MTDRLRERARASTGLDAHTDVPQIAKIIKSFQSGITSRLLLSAGLYHAITSAAVAEYFRQVVKE